MTARTENLLDAHLGNTRMKETPASTRGSADYNLTLINEMETSANAGWLRAEPLYGMGPCSVSWHADSGLKDYSSIAVYHQTQASDWRVGLRVSDDAEKKDAEQAVPPVAVQFRPGDAYYFLHDFNHSHEHAVLTSGMGSSKVGSGSSSTSSSSEKKAKQQRPTPLAAGVRYSSTHRVARDESHTWAYIARRCDRVTQVLGEKPKAKEKQAAQVLLDELEFEWVRQWFVQGETHAKVHPYWHRPMEHLVNTWVALQRHTQREVEALLAKAGNLQAKGGERSILVAQVVKLAHQLEERASKREAWEMRVRDKVWKTLPEDCRPLPLPKDDARGADVTEAFASSALSRSLARRLRLRLEEKNQSAQGNWERLQARLSGKKESGDKEEEEEGTTARDEKSTKAKKSRKRKKASLKKASLKGGTKKGMPKRQKRK
eukprot:CAMPEP_0185790724 /NCGR_PEP_ID=MMETSP1174-20130828/157877_1 /TAXON_ID=35687 /ORGANISM="Dictyocha speculum, Strain CCMP1381" /LENGTH=430 /DNA_ID=CAMNT_0028485551 /DNA_START=167 /DNA_END=1459 /DNA_ORIENTATION=+